MKKSPYEIVQRTCGRGIGSFEFDDGSTRWQTHAAITNNSKAANDETANARRAAA